jgi:hypothetical protein
MAAKQSLSQASENQDTIALDRRVYEKFIVMGHHRPPPLPRLTDLLPHAFNIMKNVPGG